MRLSRFQALLLAILTSWLLPLSIGCLIFNYAILVLAPAKNLRKQFRGTLGFKARKILISGVGTPYGLRLARAFHEVGHDVIGVDSQSSLIPLHARWCTSLVKYRRLRARTDAALVRELQSLIQTESVDLWIDCSQSIPLTTLTAAKQIEQRTSCVCFVAPDNVVALTSTPQAFIAFADQKGLPVPDSHHVKSRDDIHNVLNHCRGKKRYVLKSSNSSAPVKSQTLLPRRTLSQTYNDVALVKIRDSAPLWLEQYLDGLQKYRSFSILAKGQVQAFSACQQSRDGSYTLLRSAPLQTSMMRFVASLAQHFGSDVSCHLCVDFCVDEKENESGVEQRVLPINGRVVAESTGLSFQGIDGSIDLVRAYLSVFSSSTNGSVNSGSTLSNGTETHSTSPPGGSKDVYSFGVDVAHLSNNMFGFFTVQPGLSRIFDSALDILRHMSLGQECVYDFNDPLPAWYLYQIHIPIRLFIASFGRDQKLRNLEIDVKRLIS